MFEQVRLLLSVNSQSLQTNSEIYQQSSLFPGFQELYSQEIAQFPFSFQEGFCVSAFEATNTHLLTKWPPLVAEFSQLLCLKLVFTVLLTRVRAR